MAIPAGFESATRDDADDEPSLGSFDRMTDQSKSWRLRLWDIPGVDAEQDDSDSEDDDPEMGVMKESQQHRRHAIQLACQLPD